MRPSLLLGIIFLSSPALLSHAADVCDRPPTEKGPLSFYLDSKGTKTAGYALEGHLPTDFELELRSTCRSFARQSLELGSGVPKSCQDLIDTRSPDSNQNPAFSGLIDPRRCISTGAVTNFKKDLRDALVGKLSTVHHQYSPSEIRAFLKPLWNKCSGQASLAEKYRCIETNAHSVFDKLRIAREKFGKANRETLSSQETCGILKEAGLEAESVQFLAEAAQNQSRPSNLPEKDYPSFLECKMFDFKTSLAKCEPNTKLGESGAACLAQALRFTAEDYKFCTPLTRAGHVCAFSETLAKLRNRAIELSVFSRACQSDLNFGGLFSGSVPQKNDSETKRRCLADEVAELEAIRDPYEWLSRKEKIKSNSVAFDDSELKKAGIEKCETPQAKTDEKVTKAAAQAMQIIKVLPDSAEDKTSPTSKSKPQSADLTQLEFNSDAARKIIHSVLDENLADESLSPEQKKLLESLKKNEKYIEKIATSYVDSAEKLRKKNLPDYKIALQTLDDYREKVDRELSEALLQAAKKRAGAMAAKTTQPSPTPTASAAPAVKSVQSPVREDLITQAKSELEKFKKNAPDDADYAEFFSKLEADGSTSAEDQDEQITKFKRQLKPYLDRYKTLAGENGKSFEAQKKLFKELNQDFLKTYVEKQARMSDFFTGAPKGGNCDARARILLTALQASGLYDVNGYQPVMQFFHQHVQFMLYNKEKNLLIDPVTGKSINGISTPLYDPRIVFQSYLKKAGEPLELKDDDFIVAKADSKYKSEVTEEEKKKSADLKTSSDFSSAYPKNNQRFGSGQNPAVATTVAPDFDRDSISPEQWNGYGFSNNDLYTGESQIADGTLLSEIAPSIGRWYRKAVDVWGYTTLSAGGRKIFREKEDAEKYKDLVREGKDTTPFFKELGRKNFAKLQSTKEYQDFENTLLHPELLTTLDSKEIEKQTTFFRESTAFFSRMEDLSWYRRSKSYPGAYEFNFEDPERERAFKAVYDFGTRFKNNPKELFKILSLIEKKDSPEESSKKINLIAKIVSSAVQFASNSHPEHSPTQSKYSRFDPDKFKANLKMALLQQTTFEAKQPPAHLAELGFLLSNGQTGKAVEFDPNGSSPSEKPLSTAPKAVPKKNKKMALLPLTYVRFIVGDFHPTTICRDTQISSRLYQLYNKEAKNPATPDENILSDFIRTCFDVFQKQKDIDRLYPDGPREYALSKDLRVPKEIALEIRALLRTLLFYTPETHLLMVDSYKFFSKDGSIKKFVEDLEEQLKKNGVELDEIKRK